MPGATIGKTCIAYIGCCLPASYIPNTTNVTERSENRLRSLSINDCSEGSNRTKYIPIWKSWESISARRDLKCKCESSDKTGTQYCSSGSEWKPNGSASNTRTRKRMKRKITDDPVLTKYLEFERDVSSHLPATNNENNETVENEELQDIYYSAKSSLTSSFESEFLSAENTSIGSKDDDLNKKQSMASNSNSAYFSTRRSSEDAKDEEGKEREYSKNVDKGTNSKQKLSSCETPIKPELSKQNEEYHDEEEISKCQINGTHTKYSVELDYTHSPSSNFSQSNGIELSNGKSQNCKEPGISLQDNHFNGQLQHMETSNHAWGPGKETILGARDVASQAGTSKEINGSDEKKDFSVRSSVPSKGAVPKIGKRLNLSTIRNGTPHAVGPQENHTTSELLIAKSNESNEEDFHHLESSHGESQESSIDLGKKLHDSKNMTAEVRFNNTPSRFNTHSFGKDVLDNGTTRLLSTTLSVHPAANVSTKERLKTFKNWPNRNIDPKKLAAAGFYYCGKADIVECFVCGIKGHNWVENDKPMEDHRRWNKNCPFVRENTTEHDNVQSGRDICGNLGVEICPNSEPEDNTQPEPNLEKLGIQKAKGPSHPDQIIYESRLATFNDWPKSLKQKPSELASAGFYYLGVGDQTLCFYCGGGLKDWVEEDDPWEQHALWFPKCNYLLLKKTPAFVEAVQNKHNCANSCKKEETAVEASCSTSESNAKEPSSAVIEEKEEKKSDDSSTLCKICFKNELGVVFLPCGHMVACIDCASALKECAVCRKSIQATVRAFLS